MINNISNNIKKNNINHIYACKKNSENNTDRQLNYISKNNVSRKIFINHRNIQKEKMNFSITDNS